MKKKSVLNETFNCELKMQTVANLIKQRIQINLCIILHRVSMAVLLLLIASRDWETVKYVVPGNSSSKPDQLGSERKGDEQSLKYLIILIFIYLFIYLSILFIYLF